MTLVYRAVKGSRLTSAEGDGNIHDLDDRITALETSPPDARSIDTIELTGTLLTITYTDATTDEFTIPVATFRARGDWAPSETYAANDIVVYGGAAYLVLQAHVSDTVFDPGASDSDGDFYAPLIPALTFTGTIEIWVPAGDMTARTTNGAAAGSAEMSSNKNMLATLDFDATTQEFAQFDVAMPARWDGGTVTCQAYWSHASTVTNFGVVWGFDAVSISNDDSLDVAFGTEQTATDTGGTTNDLYISPESSDITIAGTPAAGDLVQFRVHRNPAAGSDTLAVDARLHGVKIRYTASSATDG